MKNDVLLSMALAKCNMARDVFAAGTQVGTVWGVYVCVHACQLCTMPACMHMRTRAGAHTHTHTHAQVATGCQYLEEALALLQPVAGGKAIAPELAKDIKKGLAELRTQCTLEQVRALCVCERERGGGGGGELVNSLRLINVLPVSFRTAIPPSTHTHTRARVCTHTRTHMCKHNHTQRQGQV